MNIIKLTSIITLFVNRLIHYCSLMVFVITDKFVILTQEFIQLLKEALIEESIVLLFLRLVTTVVVMDFGIYLLVDYFLRKYHIRETKSQLIEKMNLRIYELEKELNYKNQLVEQLENLIDQSSIRFGREEAKRQAMINNLIKALDQEIKFRCHVHNLNGTKKDKNS
uniref:Uncharacterized protein n=1 Tax=Pseudellipsoidion edaphicum TaxID=1431838 RepID=A0A3R5QSL3_9STRA|nr:hypothetical protein [Pseudellipsoidion edaphicum]QAA11965.1 hypothetical protein [Pseudellipsoidion edaphicum]